MARQESMLSDHELLRTFFGLILIIMSTVLLQNNHACMSEKNNQKTVLLSILFGQETWLFKQR